MFRERPLASFVKCLWFSQGDPAPYRQERVLPNGAMQLVISLHEENLRVYDRHKADQFQSFPTPLLAGMQSQYAVIDTAPQASMIGMAFNPGGALPFFPCAANELQDAHVPLECFWGRGANDLRDRLLEARTPAGKFQILERFLMVHAVRPLELHPAVAFALSAFQDVPPQKTISQVVNQVSLGSRRFIEVFSESVGLTPKMYCRIRRFQEVLRFLSDGQNVALAEIAPACGYFDQAHFIPDFHDFSGLNPTAYLAHRSEYVNHVSLH